MDIDPENPAIGPNGHLRDASDIVWYHDADDDVPMPPLEAVPPAAQPPTASLLHRTPSATSVVSTASSPSSSPLPATIIAKVRRTRRSPKPSARLQLALENAAQEKQAKQALGKRKGSAPSTSAANPDADVVSQRRKHHKQAQVDSESEAESSGTGFHDERVGSASEDGQGLGDEDAEGETEEQDEADDDVDQAEEIEEAYLRTKAYGDNDRSTVSLS